MTNAFSRSYQLMDHYEWSLTWKLMDQSVLYWPFCVAQTRTTVWYWIVNFPYFSYFFGLWFDWIYVVSCVLAESEGGVLIFECNQEYTNDPQWFTVLCLEKGQYNTPWSISFQGKTKFPMASCTLISMEKLLIKNATCVLIALPGVWPACPASRDSVRRVRTRI